MANVITSDFTLNITCIAAPFQCEGVIGDSTWYFRSRHGRWRLEINDEVVDVGTDSLNGHMALGKIVELLEQRIIDVAVAREDAQYDQAMDAYYG